MAALRRIWSFHIFIHNIPVQRHITGVLENTRVFDKKYPGIFQYPGFIDKYPGIFHQIPGYLTACDCLSNTRVNDS